MTHFFMETILQACLESQNCLGWKIPLEPSRPIAMHIGDDGQVVKEWVTGPLLTEGQKSYTGSKQAAPSWEVACARHKGNTWSLGNSTDAYQSEGYMQITGNWSLQKQERDSAAQG